MQKMTHDKINTIAAFSGFSGKGGFKRRITPIRFELPSGEVHKVKRVRRTYTDKVGSSLHIHFVIVTQKERYFDLLYDSGSMNWYLVVELEENLFFND